MKKEKRQYIIAYLLALWLFSCFPSGYTWSQITQPSRYEKEFSIGDGFFTIISLKQEGLCLVRDKDKYSGGKKLWDVVLLDSALQEKKAIEILLESRNQLTGYEYAPGQVYLLYRIGDTNRNQLEVVEIKLDTYEVRYHQINPELALQLSHFTKAGNSVVIGGYVNREPTILLYDLTSQNIKVLPGFFQKDTELVDLRVNQNNTFNVILIDRDSREQNKLILRTFDDNGKILLEDEVPIDPKKALQTGITSTLEREDMIIAGNWGERNSKQSSGFFAIPVDPFSDQKIQYLHFGEMDHYLDYLNPKRAKNIKSKSLKEIKEGRTPNYINYVMPYRIQEHKTGYLLLAEVYQPSSGSGFPSPYYPYHMGPYDPYYGGYYAGMRRFYPYPYNYNGGPRQQQSQEVKTFESVVMALDANGKLLWDHSFKLDDIKSSALEQIADFHLLDSRMVFLYKKESELKVKVIFPDADETQEITEPIRLTKENDEVRSEKEYEGGVRQWYKNTFYVWGYHTLKNNNLEDRVREVFYINKVVAQ